MESASCELALKPNLYNNRPIHSKYFCAGNTRLLRTSNLARGNTQFPRTWCLARGKHPHSAHLSLARSQHPRQPQGFGSLPTSRPASGNSLHDSRSLPCGLRIILSYVPSLGGFPFLVTRSHLHTPDSNKFGMRLTNHFISTIGRIHSHPCIRPTSILSE